MRKTANRGRVLSALALGRLFARGRISSPPSPRLPKTAFANAENGDPDADTDGEFGDSRPPDPAGGRRSTTQSLTDLE